MAKDPVRDGAKFYTSPKIEKKNKPPADVVGTRYLGYNGGYCECTSHTAAGKYTAYWERRLMDAFRYSLPLHVPDNWDKSYIYTIGTLDGQLAVTRIFGGLRLEKERKPKPYELGVHAVRATLGGHDLYYRPQFVTLSNSRANELNGANRKYIIGSNCELLRFSPDYHGYFDTIRHYAETLSKASSVLNTNLVGNRLVWAAAAKGSNSAETMKAMLQEMEREDPLVVLNTALFDDRDKEYGDGKPWQFLSQNLKATFIAPDAQETLEKIWLSALRALGIPTPYEKAEHAIGSENDMLSGVSGTLMDCVVDTLEESINKVVVMFPELDGELYVDREELKYSVNDKPGVTPGSAPGNNYGSKTSDGD